ncbi:hypothetical protein [Xanthobacter agilis]|uniref:hypothetical protein n=1 Tax=Xanthobacter agilis TaxID=47492 RepID=UPI003726BE11
MEPARQSLLKQMVSGSAEPANVAPNTPLPAVEAAFIAAVEAGRSVYSAGQTDFQKGAARPTRASAICKVVGSPAVRNWVGKVTTLTTNGEGKGVLGITIAKDTAVMTWNNSLSDIADNTLIAPGSSLFNAMGTLKEGDTVRFSGSFIREPTDCFREQSMTMRGSMTGPEFIFRFKSVEKL